MYKKCLFINLITYFETSFPTLFGTSSFFRGIFLKYKCAQLISIAMTQMTINHHVGQSKTKSMVFFHSELMTFRINLAIFT